MKWAVGKLSNLLVYLMYASFYPNVIHSLHYQHNGTIIFIPNCTHFISKEKNEFQIKCFIVSQNAVDLILIHTGLKQLQIYNFKSGS